MTHQWLSRPSEPPVADVSAKVNGKLETPLSGLGKCTDPSWFSTNTEAQC